MNTNLENRPKLALLIDADNISAKYLDTILNEIPKYGVATYRRIYGDFTDSQMASWRPKLLDNSITPVQQFSNVKSHKPGEKAGKNATDSTLIIDAMDILYAGKVDGFVIVSSDSDFTRLASRLRESNMIVVGMGRNQTSISFRHACTKFINIEYLYKLDQNRSDGESASTIPSGDDVETTVTLANVENVVAGVIRDNDNRGRATSLGVIGDSLNNKFPDFDVRNFGYSKLSTLIKEMPRFELVMEEGGGSATVRIKETETSDARIFAFITEELGKRDDKTLVLSSLATKVYRRFPDFNLKDTGYSQFYKFVGSCPAIEVAGDSSRKTATLVSSEETPAEEEIEAEAEQGKPAHLGRGPERRPRRRTRIRKDAAAVDGNKAEQTELETRADEPGTDAAAQPPATPEATAETDSRKPARSRRRSRSGAARRRARRDAAETAETAEEGQLSASEETESAGEQPQKEPAAPASVDAASAQAHNPSAHAANAGGNQPIRPAETSRDQDVPTAPSANQVYGYMIAEIGKHEDRTMGIAPLATRVRKQFPAFNLAEMGFKQFYKFVASCKDIEVIGEGRHRQAKLVQ